MADDGSRPTAEEQQILVARRGYRVLQLVRPCDGLPVYTNALVNPNLELTSFRGQFLRDAENVLGDALLERAYQNLLPVQLLAYGRELQAVATAYARAHGVEEIAARRECPDADEGSPESVAHIVASAARWCAFWAARGHWLNADY
jgi:hypothetical protein